MYNTDNYIDGYRSRNKSGNRYGSEDIPDYLPSQEEDVFSFRQLQLHQHKKKNSNRQKQQIMRRPSMYEKIVSELAQNTNSDHLQLVGSSQDLDKNMESDNSSQTSSTMNGNNGLLKRHLSCPAERFTTYDRIVHELSIERSRSLDKSMSVIGGGYSDIRTTNDDGAGLTLDDYSQLQNNEYAELSHKESHVKPLTMPNFTTLGMMNEDKNKNDNVNTELGGMDFYTSKEMKNDYNNMSKVQGQGTYDDHSLNQDNRGFSQTHDQNLLNRVSSLSIHPAMPPKDDSIANNESGNLNNHSLDSDVRLYEGSNQHISSSWSDNENQIYLKSDDLLSTDGHEPQTSNYISGPNSIFSSLESANKWGVSEAIKGAITGFFGETVKKTSPERAQQVREIADLNHIFRY